MRLKLFFFATPGYLGVVALKLLLPKNLCSILNFEMCFSNLNIKLLIYCCCLLLKYLDFKIVFYTALALNLALNKKDLFYKQIAHLCTHFEQWS